jgi:hypothetical protein
MNRLLLILLLLVSTAAAARMYQWQNPNSKSIQFSGEPPAWYRNSAAGPRVRVFVDGKLVDDTTIRLSPEDDQSMRDIAFRAVQEEQQLEAIKRLERTARREDRRRRQARREALRAQAKTEAAESTEVLPEALPEVLPEFLDAEMIERLKSIVFAYDRANDIAPIQTSEGAPPSGAKAGASSN